ncbi:MAG: hypothetical protein ACKVP0_11445 [Pirellulaceae bacterium]
MSTIRTTIGVLITILAITAAVGTTHAAGKPKTFAQKGQIAQGESPSPSQFAKDYLNPARIRGSSKTSSVWLPGTYSKAPGNRPGK